MAKSNNRWDVIYETVDEQAHKIVPHFAAQNVDYKTALMVKRNHKKICAMEIRPTQRAPDRLAVWAGVVNFYQCCLAVGGSCNHRRQVTQTVSIKERIYVPIL